MANNVIEESVLDSKHAEALASRRKEAADQMHNAVDTYLKVRLQTLQAEYHLKQDQRAVRDELQRTHATSAGERNGRGGATVTSAGERRLGNARDRRSRAVADAPDDVTGERGPEGLGL